MKIKKVKMVLREVYELGFMTFYATIEDGDYTASICAEDDRFEFCGWPPSSKIYERVDEIPESAKLRTWVYNRDSCLTGNTARSLEFDADDDRRELREDIRQIVEIIKKYESEDK